MSDVAFIVLTIAVFVVMALVVRGVERLVGPVANGDRSDSLSGERHTAHLGADSDDSSGSRDDSSGSRDDSSGSRDASVVTVGAGVLPDGQVVR